MPNPTSSEKRADIIKHMQAGETVDNVSKWLFLSQKTVKRVWRKYISTGTYEPAPKNCGRKPKVSEEKMNEVLAKIAECPDMTLSELIEDLKLPICESALWKRLHKHGLTFKKKHYIQKHKSVKM